MAVYAIGDVQGCFRTLERLLDEIRFDPRHDRLWFAGDLVNRGPRNVEVLRWMLAHERSIVTVLGNHDLHLLASSVGARARGKRSTLGDVLDADDRPELIGWLRRQPLLHRQDGFTMIHAGLLPAWTLDVAETKARLVEARLRSDDWPSLMRELQRGGDSEVVEAASALTRIRFVDRKGRSDERSARPPEQAPPNLRPWYEGREDSETLLFGHWAWHDHRFGAGWIALDSGCVWGRCLTAVRLDDRTAIQVAYCD